MNTKVAPRGLETEMVAYDGRCCDKAFVSTERGVLYDDGSCGGDCGRDAVLGDDESCEQTGARKELCELLGAKVGPDEIGEGRMDAVSKREGECGVAMVDGHGRLEKCAFSMEERQRRLQLDARRLRDFDVIAASVGMMRPWSRYSLARVGVLLLSWPGRWGRAQSAFASAYFDFLCAIETAGGDAGLAQALATRVLVERALPHTLRVRVFNKHR